MKNICYILSQGFSYRMIVQSGLVERLTDNWKVTLILPDITPELQMLKSENPNLRILLFNEKAGYLERFSFLIRRYILEDFRSNVALLEKHKRALSTGSTVTKIICYLGIFLNFISQKSPRFVRAYKIFEKLVFSSKKIRCLLQNLSPDCISVTYPVMTPEPSFAVEAKKLKIPLIYHMLSWDNLTAKGKFVVAPDYWFSWGDKMNKEIIDLYEVSSDKIYKVGVPHFDSHRKRQKSPKFYKKDKKHLLFAMSPSIYNEFEIDIIEHLFYEVLSDNELITFVVRPHPHDVQGTYNNDTLVKRLKKLENDGCDILWPRITQSKMQWSMTKADMHYFSAILQHTDVLLNSGSTVAIEAAICSSEVIFTAFDGLEERPYWQSARKLMDYTHLSDLASSGAFHVAYSMSDLLNAIDLALKAPKTEQLVKLANVYVYTEKDTKSNDLIVKAYNAISDKISC